MPRIAARHAHQTDRHRPVQVRRVPAQSSHPRRQKPRLLEAWQASPRRHRLPDHQRRLDAPSDLHVGKVGFLSRRDDAAIEGREKPGTARGLPNILGQCRSQSARQPGGAALRQCRSATGDVAQPRPQVVHRHHYRRRGRDRRGDAAGAERALGDAGRHAQHVAGL